MRGIGGGAVKTLIVATNFTSADTVTSIASGSRHRVDYINLSERIGGQYIDYNAIPAGLKSLRALEKALRLDIRQAHSVAKLVHDQQYDTVYSLSERVGIPLALLLPNRVRHIVQVHHLLSPRKLRILRALRIPQRWNMTLVYTQREASVMPGLLHLKEGRIRRLRDKVDTEFWQTPTANKMVTRGELPSPPYIWSVGASYRDYPSLIEALRQLPHIPGWVHPGSSWVANDQSGLQAALPPNVQFSTRYLSEINLRERYYASRLVVVPLQRTTLWNAGSNAVLEAQAMGKAVIATRTPGMEDYILHGETGLLVEPEDPAALVLAIGKLWEAPERLAEMGRRARQWVEENFSFDGWLSEAEDLLTAPTPST